MAVKKVISVEVGITYTRVCEIDYHSRNPRIYRCFDFVTPDNTVEDGYIRDKDRFVDCLRSELQKEGAHATHVVFTVASTKITSREVRIPCVKDNRIGDVVKANLSEYFPMNLDDYTVTYDVLEKKTAQDDRGIRLLVLAAPNNLIKNYYNVAQMLGLTIVAIDYIGNSTFQIVKKQTAPGVQMVLHISEQSTIIYILEDSVLLLQRTVPYGIENLIDSVIDSSCYQATNRIEALNILQKEHVLNGTLKVEIDLSETAATYVGSQEQYQRQMHELHAKEEATSTLNYLISNVIRVEEYCASKFKDKRINTIYITGIGAKVRGIHKLLSNETGIDVKKIDHLIGVNFKLAGADVQEEMYIPSVGAALKPLDFVPEDVQLAKERKGFRTGILIMILSAVVSVIFVGVSLVSYISSKNTLKDLEHREVVLSEVEQLNAKYVTSMNQVDALNTLYHGLFVRNDDLVTIIEELEKALPKKVEITSLESQTSGLSLAVKATSKEQIAQLIMNIKQIPEISNITVGVMTETKDDNSFATWNTTLECIYSAIQVEQ